MQLDYLVYAIKNLVDPWENGRLAVVFIIPQETN